MSDERKLLVPNSFQTPNLIIDDLLPYLKGTELKILIFLIRKTFGWQKKRDRISLTQFIKGTGVGRPNVVEALKQLRECNLIVREKTTKGDIYELNINWKLENHTKWFQNRTGSKTEPVLKQNQSGSKIEPVSGSKIEPTETHYINPLLETNITESNDSENSEGQSRQISDKGNGKHQKPKKKIYVCDDGKDCKKCNWHVLEFARRHEKMTEGIRYDMIKADFGQAQRIHKIYDCSQLIKFQELFWQKFEDSPDAWSSQRLSFTVFVAAIKDIIAEEIHKKNGKGKNRAKAVKTGQLRPEGAR